MTRSRFARFGASAMVVVIAVALAWLLACRAVVSVDLAVLASGSGQALEGCFYFDQGRGWYQADSVCFGYDRIRLEEFVTYTVPLQNVLPPRRLRFDPLPSVGTVAVRRMSLRVGLWTTTLDLGVASGRTPHDAHATQSSIEGDKLVIKLLGDDPYLIVADDLGTAGYWRAVGILGVSLSIAWLLVQAAAGLRGVARLRRLERHAWLLVPAVLAFAGARAWALWFVYPTDVSFEIVLRTRSMPEESLAGCFFYDAGDGFSEGRKTCFVFDRHPSDQYQRYEVRIRSISDLQSLRFDPSDHPGSIGLRNVVITTSGTKRVLDLERDLGRTLYGLNQSQLEIRSGELLVQMTGRDPQIMLRDHLDGRGGAVQSRVIAEAALTAFLAVVLCAALRSTGSQTIQRVAAVISGARRRTAPFARTAALGFLVAALGVKLFVVLTSSLHFGRSLTADDWMRAPSSDLLVVLIPGAALWLMDRFEKLWGHGTGAVISRGIVALLEGILGVALWLLATVYLLSAYVFWEWGAFLESDVLLIIYRSPVPESFRHYLTRPAMLVVLLSALACVGASLVIRRGLERLHQPRPVFGAIALGTVIWSFGAIAPILDPYRFDPSVSSPVFLALRQEPLRSDDLGYAVPPTPPEDLQPPQRRPVPESFTAYHGAAADRDVILVVLESVRRSNLELYGYDRATMPHLAGLASRGLVFQNAFATQPRSSKTLDALMLGVDPDPRMEPFTWTPERVVGSRHFPGILRDLGYHFYFGIGWNPSTDGFLDFMSALAGNALDRVVGLEDLVASGRGSGLTDDEKLVEDFLSWYGPRTTRTAALIWLQAAHHPYSAPRKKFPEKSAVDRYDNCLYSTDLALGRLASGLAQRGKRPLIAIFGDHGEAFGEHVGDVLHGNLLYDQSIRVPFVLLFDSEILTNRRDIDARFSMKDVPATLLYLLGIDEEIGQSEVVFSKTSRDKLYLSTVFGDYKLGFIDGDYKFMVRPTRRLRYLFDLAADPAELRNLIGQQQPITDVAALEADVVRWYFAQIAYLERRYPRTDPNQERSR